MHFDLSSYSFLSNIYSFFLFILWLSFLYILKFLLLVWIPAALLLLLFFNLLEPSSGSLPSVFVFRKLCFNFLVTGGIFCLKCFYSLWKCLFSRPWWQCCFLYFSECLCRTRVHLSTGALGWRGPFLSGASFKNAAEHAHSGWAGAAFPSGLLGVQSLEPAVPFPPLLLSKPSCLALSMLCSPFPGAGVTGSGDLFCIPLAGVTPHLSLLLAMITTVLST